MRPCKRHTFSHVSYAFTQIGGQEGDGVGDEDGEGVADTVGVTEGVGVMLGVGDGVGKHWLSQQYTKSSSDTDIEHEQ